MLALSSVEAAIRADRRVVVGGLVVTVALAWAYQGYMAWGMEHPSPGMALVMPNMQLWRAWDLALLFVMWFVMMVAMMVPSVAPTVLLFAAVQRRRRDDRAPFVPTAVFAGGYVVAWAVFSLAATVAQWRLHQLAVVSSEMVTTKPLVSGALLVATGAFQWTPWKDACLSRCRSPLGFLLGHWRDGHAGAFRVGFLHGAFCVGCCALLMLLLFVEGVMNILWMAALSTFVLVEKLVPAHRWMTRSSGVALCAWGLHLMWSR